MSGHNIAAMKNKYFFMTINCLFTYYTIIDKMRTNECNKTLWSVDVVYVYTSLCTYICIYTRHVYIDQYTTVPS